MEALVPLADTLARLRIQGAIFLHARYTEAWAFSSVPMQDLGAMLAPDATRLVPFHVVAAGTCWIEVDGGERHWARAGDVIVLPYSDRHRMGGTADAVVVDAATLVPPPPWSQMPYIVHGDGGDQTRVVCGYITCDDPLFDPDLRALPPVFVVTPTGVAADWVRASLDFAMQQTSLVGGEHVQTPPMLVQLLLVEVLKLHLESAPAAQRGFVRALHDPVVAAAMARIHAEPERKWTVGDLAAAGNVSTSVLDERFRSELGLPPIRYLTGWRMHLAQDLLSSTTLGVATVARRVGYESEEAFSRAFKRKHGAAPSLWRVARTGAPHGIGGGGHRETMPSQIPEPTIDDEPDPGNEAGGPDAVVAPTAVPPINPEVPLPPDVEDVVPDEIQEPEEPDSEANLEDPTAEPSA